MHQILILVGPLDPERVGIREDLGLIRQSSHDCFNRDLGVSSILQGQIFEIRPETPRTSSRDSARPEQNPPSANQVLHTSPEQVRRDVLSLFSSFWATAHYD